MSHLEEMLAFQIKAVGLEEPVREFKFHPKRRWRFDFAWPSRKLACEVHGGTSDKVRGRHVRMNGFEKDREKMNSAILDDWRVIELTANMVKDGTGIGWIEKCLA